MPVYWSSTFKLKCLVFKYRYPLYTLITSYVLITDPPNVLMLSQQDILEGKGLTVTCTATPGNPGSNTFYWTKIDNVGFRQNGSTLLLPNIQRNSSGTYRCTAENIFMNGERGTDSQSFVASVRCKVMIYYILKIVYNRINQLICLLSFLTKEPSFGSL